MGLLVGRGAYEVRHDIPPSNSFLPARHSADPADIFDFEICTGNWLGAVEFPDLLSSMVQSEIEAGYLEVLRSLAEAQARWPQVAVGKVNIVQAPGKKPRLILDPTISGVNAALDIPKRFMLPTLEDVRVSYPLRGVTDEVHAMTLDSSAAHKTVRVRENERGLLGLQVDGAFYFYKVAPFGGSFSAHWWQRPGRILCED